MQAGNVQNRTSRLEKRVQAVRDEIKSVAWAQVEEHGAPALSLRAIAGTMGLTAPALYRYFPSRNHLVTALILDAFTSLAETQEGVLVQYPPESDWVQAMRGLGQAYRSWALSRPAAFFLIFGDPIPEYEAPWQETMPVAGKSLKALIRVLEAAAAAGDLKLPLEPPPGPELRASLEAWNTQVHHSHPELLFLAFTVATRVQGLVLAELGRQLPPFFPHGGELYARELERIIREVRG